MSTSTNVNLMSRALNDILHSPTYNAYFNAGCMLLQNLTHAGGNNMSPMSLNILSRVGPLHVTAIGEFWNYTKY